MLIPKLLSVWSKLITLSLSRGGAWLLFNRYRVGKKQCIEATWVDIVEWKYVLEDAKRIYEHPEARAEDLMNACKDSSIDGIISTIWGEDSIRMLPYIDFDVIAANPKVFMGYSDSTITHFIFYKAGVRSYYGPAIMAWFGENGWLFSYMTQSVKKVLFSIEPIWIIMPNQDWWTNELLDWWNPNNQFIKRKLNTVNGWRWVQWNGKIQGELLWWCIDVFPFMIGTLIWPSLEDRKNKILFIETSEERISKIHFERIIRNLWSQWILQVLSWIIMGRSQLDDQTGEQINYDDSLLKIINIELWLSSLPIVTNMDFGHTDPMFIIPYWAKAIIDFDNQIFSIDEAGIR